MNKLKYLIIDVDGTMTDGGIFYDEFGNEIKKFNTKDAAGFFVCKKLGIKTVVITGRECKATEKRMNEMNIDYLFQVINDKVVFLKDFIEKNNIKKDELGYIGDDLNDYQSMKLAGYIACPSDACFEVKQIADYISYLKGGDGVIRDVVEHIFRNSGKWESAVNEVYKIGI